MIIIWIQFDGVRRHPASESRREDGPGTESTKRCGKGHAAASRHFRSCPFVPVRTLPGQCMLCDSGSRDAGQTGVRQVRQKTAQYEIHISEDISRRWDKQAQGIARAKISRQY